MVRGNGRGRWRPLHGLAVTPDAGTGALPRRARRDALVLQSLALDRELPLRPLYWTSTAGGAVLDAGRVLLPDGAMFSSDTYFGNFFEFQWRLHTTLASLSLRLDLQGGGIVRIKRQTPHGGETLLEERRVAGPVTIDVACEVTHFRQAGRLWFELVADGELVLSAASWVTRDSARQPVRLGLGICTYNRERPLAQVLERIEQHPALDGLVERIIVVNQGTPELGRRLPMGPRVDVIEQANLGGAGGFGRAMLEFLDDDTLTHLCLLDDDVAIEPDSLVRLCGLFALARSEFAVGGHMLDAVQPFRLYEAGGLVGGNGMLQPLMQGLDLREAETLDALLDTVAMDYNGWWMFAASKLAVREAGLPLPCFIRGDDVEYGVRLAGKGVPTLSVPGVSIWHDPFYLKIGNWQLYYETRNGLVFQALHRATPPGALAATMLKHLLTHLLTFRYYSAALVVCAIEDYLSGPGFLHGDPRPIHARLLALKTEFPEEWTRREQALPQAQPAESPSSYAGFVARIVRALCRNAVRPSPSAAPAARLKVQDLVWFRVVGADCLAVDTVWDERLPTYRRDRASFLRLSGTGLRAIWRLYRTHGSVAPRVQAASVSVTSPEFWRDYVRRTATPAAGKTPVVAES